MKIILKSLVLLLVMIGFSGCVKYMGKAQIPKDKYLEKNSKVKLYYEDTNRLVIKKDLENTIEYISNKDIKTASIPTEIKENLFDRDLLSAANINFKFISNDTNMTFRFDLFLTEDNYIQSKKTYSSKIDVYNDFLILVQYLFDETKNNSELKNKLGTSNYIYLDSKSADKGILKFTSKKEIAREILAKHVEVAFFNAGYHLVDSPSKADKIVYFQLTRDYQISEVNRLKKEGKSLDFNVINSGINLDTNVIGASMNVASLSNSSGASVGIGLGVGLVFSLFDLGKDKNLIFPTFKITDVKDKKSYLYVLSTLSYIHTNQPFGVKRRAYFSDDSLKPLFAAIRKFNEGKEYYKKIEINKYNKN